MREFVVMQEQHTVDELVRDVSHLLQWVWLVVVVFLELQSRRLLSISFYITYFLNEQLVGGN